MATDIVWILCRASEKCGSNHAQLLSVIKIQQGSLRRYKCTKCNRVFTVSC